MSRAPEAMTSFDGGITIYVNTTGDAFRKQVSNEDACAINNLYRVGHCPYISYLQPPRLDALTHVSGVVAFRTGDPWIKFYKMSEALGHFQRADQKETIKIFAIAYFNRLDESDADFDLICKYFENVFNNTDESWEPLEPILDYVRPVPISVAKSISSETHGPKRLVISEAGVEDRTEEPLTEEEMMMLTK